MRNSKRYPALLSNSLENRMETASAWHRIWKQVRECSEIIDSQRRG
jgi:hypothetical protein